MPGDLTSKKLRPFGTSIFATMTALAAEHGAINLSQGFPDFEGPPEIIEAAVRALREGANQYARPAGHPLLVRAIAARARAQYGLEYDPETEIVVTSGATEALTSTMLGLLDPGDEVILFEPYYDSYPASVAMAGGVVRCATLRFPDFALDADELRALFNERTRLLLLNSPHNPSGKVFSRSELEVIAGLCCEHDVIVLSDEVYEHLTYDGVEHVPISSLPGMRERTFSVHSSGKTFSLTGWKIGWGMGAAPLAAAAFAAHQFVTFTTATPLQVAVAQALEEHRETYLAGLRREYTARRDFLVTVLREAGFEVAVPRGTYFILAGFSRLWEGDDLSFARHLVEAHRVAAIPPSVFYRERPEEGRRLLRFSFSKRLETLERAAERLRGL
jgi:N-succinyldiaminopimelate aminotransferase